MKKIALLFSVLLVLVLSGCDNGPKTPYLELKNDTGYTICVRMNYVSREDDWTIPTDRSTEKWLSNGQSCVYEIDKTAHFYDIVNLAFWLDSNGDGTAQYNTNWHKGYCRNYPDNGYLYTRAYLDNEGIIHTTWEMKESARSVAGSVSLSDLEQVPFKNLDVEDITITE